MFIKCIKQRSSRRRTDNPSNVNSEQKGQKKMCHHPRNITAFNVKMLNPTVFTIVDIVSKTLSSLTLFTQSYFHLVFYTFISRQHHKNKQKLLAGTAKTTFNSL